MEYETFTAILALFVTCASLCFSYMQHRKADNAEGKKDIINRAFNAAARTAKNIILAAKDGKITEEEFQKIVTDAHEELNKIETNKDTEIAETE